MSSLSPLPDHDDPDYVLFKDLPDGKMNVELVYADLQHGEYVVPLGNNIPSEVFSENDHLLDANKWENTLVPLRLRRYLDEDRRDKGHLRPGWLYLFRNGHLWRELQIIGRYGVNLYQDVNLTEYKGKDQRPATAEAESHVLIPYQFGNKAEPFEIAYSEIQWTWARIDSYGGMSKDDPRMKNGPQVDPGNNNDDANKRREKRFRRLCLKKDDLIAHHPWLQEVREPGGGHSGRYNADVYSEQEITIVLDDQLALLRRLKREHDSIADEINGLKAYADTGEYALAQLVKSIVDNDAEQRKGNPEAADGDPLSEHIDQPFLEQTLNNWRTLDKKLAAARRKAADAVLKHLQTEDTVAVLKDFFIDATLNQMTLGVQYWVEAVWSLDVEDAYAYIRKVHNKAVSGLEPIFDPNPELAQTIGLLASGKRNRQQSDTDLGGLAPADVFKTTKDGTDTLEKLLTAFAKAHAESKPEELLQHLSVMVATYTSIDIQIRRVPLGTLIRATARRTRSVYVFQTSSMRRALEQISATRVPWLSVAGRSVARTAAELEGNPLVKRGFVGVLGVLNVVCMGFAVRAVTEKEHTASDWIALVSASGGLSSFLGEQMEHVSKHLGARVAAEGEAVTSGFRARQALGEVSAEAAEREAMLKSSKLAAIGAKFLGRASELLVRIGGPTAALADSILGVRDFVSGVSMGNAGVAVGGGMEIGAAGIAGYAVVAGMLAIPVSAPLIALGVGLALVGGGLVMYFSYSDMEKALRSCRFGKDPYAWGGSFDDPQSKLIRISDASIAPGVDVALVDLSAEMGEFSRLLFGFSLETRVHSAAGPYPMPSRPSDLGPDDVVVEVHARFSRFLPLATTLEVEAEAFVDRDVASSTTFPKASRLFRNADMVFLEQREGDALVGLRAFARLKSEEVSDHVVGRARLEVDGKGRYWVPKDKTLKEVTWNPNGWFSDDHYGRFSAPEWRRLLDVVKGQEPSPDFAIQQYSSGAQLEVLADFLGTDTIEGTA